MDTLDNQAFEKGGTVSETAFETFRSTIPWIKFISITGFVLLGFTVISTLYQMSNSYAYMRYTGWTYIIYLVVGTVFFFLNLFLFQYANNLAHFTRSKQSFDLEQALVKQKSFFMLSAILLIVYIVAIIVVIIWSLSFARGF